MEAMEYGLCRAVKLRMRYGICNSGCFSLVGCSSPTLCATGEVNEGVAAMEHGLRCECAARQ